MSRHANHAEIARRLRAESPHWVTIETDLTRSRLAGKAARWNDPRRAPEPFVSTSGTLYLFRTRRAPATVTFMSQPALNADAGRFLLEGRFIGSGPAPY